MGELKRKSGSIILNGSQVDYLLQYDGAAYIDLQVRRGRLTTHAQGYDFTFFVSDGGQGKKDCERKFPGLLALLAKRFPDIPWTEGKK
jgi:hypothetical protein